LSILVISAVVALLLTAALRMPFRALGLLDMPDERKRHGSPVPVTGGLAVALVVLAVAWFHPDSRTTFICAAALLMLISGTLDDRYRLSVAARLLLQYVGAAILVAGGLIANSLGALGELGVLAIPFTMLCIVTFINACNMIDGADGLLAGVLAPACIGLAFVVPNALQPVALATGGALIGFLAINWPARQGARRRQLRSFLGNGGAECVAVLVCGLMLAAVGPSGALQPGAIAWLALIPLAELANTVARRLRESRRTITRPDRSHLHHRILLTGVSPQRLASGYVALASFGVLCAVAGSVYLPTDVLLWAFGAAALTTVTVFGLRREQGLRAEARDTLRVVHTVTAPPPPAAKQIESTKREAA
jgi:UDP-GlcNAc:undecaprenyl-phosphate/decaprenyl-phosphate GlcNAc-1-phosphate transferase